MLPATKMSKHTVLVKNNLMAKCTNMGNTY